MPPVTSKTLKHLLHPTSLKNFVSRLAFDPSMTWPLGCLLLIAEIVLNVFIIQRVPYTEIDWQAYMQEVEGFMNGTRDYDKLEGGTGPLVYPAGFVYLFSGLYHITEAGTNIRRAQYLFAALYVATLVVLFHIYNKTRRVPPFALIFMCCASYRIHSIYVLRLFNDPVAMFILYVAVALFISDRWTYGCFMFSVAVSVKMNILLFAPGLFMLLLLRLGVIRTFINIALCGLVQLALALPFLLTNAPAYIARSFNLGRRFFFIWTVNFRFLPESVFQSRWLHAGLLLAHVAVLVCFAVNRWPRPREGWCAVLRGAAQPRKLPAEVVVRVLFVSNFVGMCFARSLHYQFYVWYFHTLPFLLWSCRLPTVARLLLLGVVEMCWNTYPSTSLSSLSLHVSHVLLLAELYYTARFDDTAMMEEEEESVKRD